jgi:predicted DNA-binding transcriptional regulator AlpA
MQPELISIDEVCRLFGDVHASTVYRWAKVRRVPRPVRVGPGISRWLRSECEAALAEMVEGRR